MKYTSVKKCPKCNGKTKVAESRLRKKGLYYRARLCLKCGFGYGTYEIRKDEFINKLIEIDKKIKELRNELGTILD